MKEIFTRRSIRKFDKNQIVSEDDITKIIKAGFSAPSARRQEPANFIIVDDKKVIEELSKISKGSMVLTDTNQCIVIVGSDPSKITNPEFEAQDLGACIENMMLEARYLGIGTCWLGVYPKEDRMDSIRKILNIPDGMFPFATMALGIPLDSSDFKEANRYYPERIHKNRF